MEQALPCGGLFSGLLGPSDLPIAAQYQEGDDLYAEDDCSGGQRGGEGFDALVLGFLGTSSATRGRGRGRLLAGEDDGAGGRHGASARSGATWSRVQGCRQWMVVIAAEEEFQATQAMRECNTGGASRVDSRCRAKRNEVECVCEVAVVVQAAVGKVQEEQKMQARRKGPSVS